jgi:hypothetical protein
LISQSYFFKIKASATILTTSWLSPPDGQRHRQLLASKDGLSNPYVLDYDKSTNRLLVVNESSTALCHGVSVSVCVVKFVSRCSYAMNANHITADYITNRFITQILDMNITHA